MRSAFGVEHGAVAKRRDYKDRRVPDALTSVVPGSTVMAYNYSRKHKGQAATANLGAKVAGSAAGSVVGAALMGVAGKRLKALGALRRGSTVLGRTVSAERKMGAAQAGAAGVLGGIGGGITGNRSLNRIKGDERYGYRR